MNHQQRVDSITAVLWRVELAERAAVSILAGGASRAGLTKDQVAALRDRFAIYAVDSGRICVAALNGKNIEAVANAIAAV